MNYFNHIPLILDGKDFIAEIATTANGTMVAIRGVCDAMGVASNSQREKIKDDPRFTWYDIVSHDTSGREQSMFCLPVEQVVPWLFTINSNKLKKPEVKENLIRFQTHLGRELNAVAFGQISTKKTAALEKQIQLMGEQIRILTDNQMKLQETLGRLVVQGATDKATIEVLTATNESLWKARGHEGSAASYSLHAAKERKKAATIL